MRILKAVLRDLLAGNRRAPDPPVTARDKGSSINPLVDYLERHPNGRQVHRLRHYFDIYHRHLARFRGQRVTMIEIGVFNGGSLPMWRDYFGPQATIVGVDINAGCTRFAESHIDIVIGDQSDRPFLRSLADRYPDCAIVLDDGGHRMDQQIATFEELYRAFAPMPFTFAKTSVLRTSLRLAVDTVDRIPSSKRSNGWWTGSMPTTAPILQHSLPMHSRALPTPSISTITWW